MITRAYLNDFSEYIKSRFDRYFNGVASVRNIDEAILKFFGVSESSEPILRTLTIDERVILLLALIPHIDPDFFNRIISAYLPDGGDFPEFGGIRGNNHRGILPTGETAQFILAGNDIEKRLSVQELFDDKHLFFIQDILWLEQVREGEPVMSGRIILSSQWVELLLTGKESKPKFSSEFPAKLTTTQITWNDVVLHPYTLEQIDDVRRWIQYHRYFEDDQNLSRKINKGYRVLFYGPPGTGKTLTATLLGKEFTKDVYRIDLSQIVSKYIGETEKNLGKIFDRAEHKNWILFFDEADALFGKRTNVQSSHDKFANQEVSFLLQRIEDFSGLLILASNFKSNIDEAFLRRFHSVVHFPMPDARERLTLWQKALPINICENNNVRLDELAEQFEISGASIINVMQFATLKALDKRERKLTTEDILEGIRKEMRKEEKSV